MTPITDKEKSQLDQYMKKLAAFVQQFPAGDLKQVFTETVALVTMLINQRTKLEEQLADASRQIASKDMVIGSMTNEIMLKNQELQLLRGKK